MEEKKLLWLAEAAGRGITPTSWRCELKGTVLQLMVQVAADPLSGARIA
jgi:hypothetical protein